MGRAADRFKNKANGLACEAHTGLDFDVHPILAEYMAGVAKDQGKAWLVPPHTITVWLQGDMVFFCMGYKGATEKFYGSFPGPWLSVDQLEKALEKEQGGWRKMS